VYITEGEFDCLALYNYLEKETPVVSSTGGCNSWRDEWTEILADYDVIIVFDTDTAGKKASVELYKKLIGKVKAVSIVYLTGEYNDICEQIYNTNMFSNFPIVPIELSLMFGNITTKASLNRTQSYIENNVGDIFYRDQLLGIVSDIYRDKFREKPVLTNIDNDIEQVKQIPITHFLDFKGGVCKCIFHSDTHPSLYYNDFNSKYPNTVKCYACGKFADVIDVVMELQRKDFKGAVEYLRGGINTQ
jgi:DNA primase